MTERSFPASVAPPSHEEIRQAFAAALAVAPGLDFEQTLAEAVRRRRQRRFAGSAALAAGLAALALFAVGPWRSPAQTAPPLLASASLTATLADGTWWEAPSDRGLGSRLGRPVTALPQLEPPSFAPRRLPLERLTAPAAPQGG